jgi:hypothetical protein
MHYTFFYWFLAPIYVSAHLVPSSGGSSRVLNLQYIQMFFTHFHNTKHNKKQFDVLKIVNSRLTPWGWHKVCRNVCRGKKLIKESVVHLLDWNKISYHKCTVYNKKSETKFYTHIKYKHNSGSAYIYIYSKREDKRFWINVSRHSLKLICP